MTFYLIARTVRQAENEATRLRLDPKRDRDGVVCLGTDHEHSPNKLSGRTITGRDRVIYLGDFYDGRYYPLLAARIAQASRGSVHS